MTKSESKKIVVSETSTVNVRVNSAPRALGEPFLMVSAGEYRVYDEVMYYEMTTDEARNEFYRAAIKKCAAGKVVLDIGTGQHVNWASEAIKCGAAKAYAAEEMDESFEGAQETIRSSNLTDKIVLVKGNSTQIELPENVDVCISEIIGMIGGSEGAAPVLKDAATRFLKPGGNMIPARCVTMIAAASLPANIYDDPSMNTSTIYYLEEVLKAVGHPFDPRMSIGNFPVDHLLSTDDIFEDLDFENPGDPNYKRQARLRVTRAGRLDGFLLYVYLWCERDSDYLDCLRVETNWCPVFFPVFYPGISVLEGDEFEFDCEAIYGVNEGADGVLPDYKISGILKRAGHEDLVFSYSSPYSGLEFRVVPFFQRLFS